MQRAELLKVGNIVLKNFNNRQSTVWLSIIRREVTEVLIMQIEIGTSGRTMQSAIYERTHHSSSAYEILHIQKSHDKTQYSRSSGYCGSGISLLQLNSLFILQQIQK